MSSVQATLNVVPPQPRWMTIAGWICTVLVALLLIAAGSFKLLVRPDANTLEELAKSGLDPKLLVPIGFIELLCGLIYLFPRTAVVGAVLLTGFMGGAIFAHVRMLDFFVVPHVVIGLLAWLGLYLREPRLRPIMFWR